MKKRLKRKKALTAPLDEPSVTGLIGKVQQQLSVLEKKLDILINQSSQRPFEKSYSSNPSPRFNHSNRYDRGRQGNGPREKSYTRVICSDCGKECEIPFKPSGDRPVYCKECFSNHKGGGPFNANRDNRFGNRQAENRQRPGKKKPFFARKKAARF